MITIIVETEMNAPIERCFDLTRDLDIHCQTTAWTHERILEGPGRLVELGDTITFEAVHFGLRRKLRGKIVAMDRPRQFKDEMLEGDFQLLTHIHEFERRDGMTIMRDTLIIVAPFGPIGWLAERLFLGEYMRRFLVRRNASLKETAEKPN